MSKTVKQLFLCILMLMCLFLFTGCTQNVENEKMTLDLKGIGERTGTYTGEVSDELPNGEGKFVTKNKAKEEWIYEGQWVKGQKEGKGETIWTESKKKEAGEYKNGWIIEGKLFDGDNLIYEGEFGGCGGYTIYEGKGKLYSGDKVIYEGYFKKDIPTDKKKFIAEAKSIAYDKLAREPQKYEGKIIKLKGKVIQVLEYDDDGMEGYVEYRVAIDDYYNDVFYTTYIRDDGEKRILEGDIVSVYGAYTGLFTYESTDGTSITIPSMDAWMIK